MQVTSNTRLSGDQVFAEHVDEVASFLTIKRISLRSISAKEAEVEAIQRKHPSVKIVVERDWGLDASF
jgi:hypothetical protein